MRKTRYNRKIRFATLFLLTVFVNLYLVQLVCSLPHLAQRLQPAAPAHAHGAGTDGHSHAHGHEASTAAHHSDESPSSPTEGTGCCTEEAYTPFVKASASVELPSLVKAPGTFIANLYQALRSSWYKSIIAAVSHAPPDNLPPKVPDIRVFLHAFII